MLRHFRERPDEDVVERYRPPRWQPADRSGRSRTRARDGDWVDDDGDGADDGDDGEATFPVAPGDTAE